jgi:hypothetical protein
VGSRTILSALDFKVSMVYVSRLVGLVIEVHHNLTHSNHTITIINGSSLILQKILTQYPVVSAVKTVSHIVKQAISFVR